MASNKPPAEKQQHPPFSHPPDQVLEQDRLRLAQELNSSGNESVRRKSRRRGKQHCDLEQSFGQDEMLASCRSGGRSVHDGESEISSPASSWKGNEVESGTSHGGSERNSMHGSGVRDAPHQQVNEVVPLLANDAGKYTRNFKVLCCLLVAFLVAAALLLAGFVTGLTLMYVNQKWNTVPVFISSDAAYQVYSGAQTFLMRTVCMKANTTNDLDWILYTASCDKISHHYIKRRRYSINSTATSGYYFYLADGSFIQPHPKGIAKYCSTTSVEQASKLRDVCDIDRNCTGERLKEVKGDQPLEDANQGGFYYICVTGNDDSARSFHLDVTELYYHIPHQERNPHPHECETVVREDEETLKCCNIPQRSAYTPGQNCVYIGNNNDPSTNPVTAPFEIELRITYDSVTVLVTSLTLTFIFLFVVVLLLLVLCFIKNRR